MRRDCRENVSACSLCDAEPSLPCFGHDLSEDPHGVVVAHVLKVHVVHLVVTTTMSAKMVTSMLGCVGLQPTLSRILYDIQLSPSSSLGHSRVTVGF